MGGPPTGRHVEGATDIEYDSDENRWQFTGDLHTIHDGDVIESVKIKINRMSEEGRQTNETVPIEIVEFDGDSDWEGNRNGDSYVGRTDDGSVVTEASFSGHSELDYERTETRLTISADIRKRGDE